MSNAHGPPRWAIPGAYALSIALLASAAVLVVTMPGGAISAFSAPWWVALLIALGYGIAERCLFDVEVRRETIAFSMSEVPAVFALAFLGPVTAIAVRVVGSMISILTVKRPPLFKSVFNVGLFSFEVAFAFSIVRRIAPPGSDPGDFLVAAGIGTTAATVAGVVMVCTVISFFEGGFVGRVSSEVLSTVIVAATGALVGTVAVAPALFSLRYAWIPALPIIGVWFVLRRHGTLAAEHSSLRDLHAFTGIIDRSLDLDEMAPLALDEISRLVRADRVTLRLRDTDETGGAHSAVWSFGDPLSFAEPHDAPAVVVGVGEPGETIDACTAFTVPIVEGGEQLGALAIAGPTGRNTVFGAAQIECATDLATQLASAIRNGMLHRSVEYAALHDALTGEANRTAFEDELREQLGTPRAGAFAVLVLDLNQFKEVNDTLGHHVGDQVLVEFAIRLAEIVEPEDLLCRLGGDEFAVLVKRRDKAEVRALAERILAMSYQPLSLDACDAVVTSSIGIAFIGEHDVNLASIMRRADIAMYAAKNQRSGIEVYREEIDRRTPARLSLLGDLRTAIEHDELEVHYQPKVDLHTSTVVGAEALVRWPHPDRGWVRPDDFIGVAEESGLIRLVTDVVLTKAIRQAAAWCAADYDFEVSVNLSALDLHGEQLATRVEELLAEHRLDPRHLVLEITESALMEDTARTMATIDQLDRMGVRLALDDFGTGYSSLAYLRRLPVAELKIDRSFVSDLLLNGNDDVIVRSTVDLGHNLGLLVVAEGIENAQVGDHLTTLGCDIGQGYGIARPLAPDLFERWLETSPYDVRRVRPIRLVAEQTG